MGKSTVQFKAHSKFKSVASFKREAMGGGWTEGREVALIPTKISFNQGR